MLNNKPGYIPMTSLFEYSVSRILEGIWNGVNRELESSEKFQNPAEFFLENKEIPT